MTGNAFLKRLKFQLDFLSAEDQKTVLAFYERKLKDTDALTEEAVVKSFGSPERIAAKLKDVFTGQSTACQAQEENFDGDAPSDQNSDSVAQADEIEESGFESESVAQKTEEDSAEHRTNVDLALETETKDEDLLMSDFECGEDRLQDTLPSENDESQKTQSEDDNQDEIDLIFSKPNSRENKAELVHSLENEEITPLFGEKVIIEQRSEPVEEIVLEPIDRENGLTPQEIENAKAETLEKAQKFDEDTFHDEEESGETKIEECSDDIDEEMSVEPFVTEDKDLSGTAVSPYQIDPLEEDAPVEYVGVFKKMFAKSTASKGTVSFLTVFLSILTFPLLILPFAAGIISYAALTLIIIFLSVLVFAIIAALVVGGVIELIYGFAMLFDTVSVALIEIGVGTVIFSFVTALTGLVYELLFGVMPKVIKFLTKKFKRYMKVLYCYLYGGNA